MLLNCYVYALSKAKLLNTRSFSTSKSKAATRAESSWVFSRRLQRHLKTFALSALVKRAPEIAESLCTTKAALSIVSVSPNLVPLHFVRRQVAILTRFNSSTFDLPMTLSLSFAQKVPNFMIQGGDFTMGNGRGGER